MMLVYICSLLHFDQNQNLIWSFIMIKLAKSVFNQYYLVK